jgi:two-component system sensor histidine kinase PilS (NtrC family)
MNEAVEPPRRRRAERRASERRADRRRDAQREGLSWFGVLGVDDTQLDDESRLPRGWSEAARGRNDAMVLSREARRLGTSGITAFHRLYVAFLGARAAIGLLLVVAQVIAGLAGNRPQLPVLLCVAYAAVAVSTWLLPRFRRSSTRPEVPRLGRLQWLATIGVDVLTFTALHVVDTSSSLNYAALLVLPVLMAGILTPRLLALATAACVALLLLATNWWMVAEGRGAALLLTQAGLAGGGYFIVTLLAGELAGRLAREEIAARGSLELARQQAQLNRLVIEEMSEGVLMVDRRGRVRAANPAARLLLSADGMARPAPFSLHGVEAWKELADAAERVFKEGRWPEAGRDVTLEFGPTLSRTLRLRVRYTRRQDDMLGDDVCVVFIEDVQTMQARLRQEKLAAMGRVSAGIAHEIRNPLAAIAQANALLAEDASDPAQARLTAMVADNVERLKRIVDDVLEVAPGGVSAGGVIDATAVLGRLTSEWATTNGLRLSENSLLHVELPGEPLGVRFDAEHLRRVLVNLLDNARRHATGDAGSVRLTFDVQSEQHAVLSVFSDGPPIPPEVERHLFEPFFSTRSRGTGLGLYICRELCERYAARIDYRRHPDGSRHRNELVVVMRREPLPVLESSLPFAP